MPAGVYWSYLTKVVGQQASGRPPLVLNKHCQVCEFQSRCRKVAVEMDDLSLLANMTAPGPMGASCLRRWPP
jgi:hypothetical protein